MIFNLSQRRVFMLPEAIRKIARLWWQWRIYCITYVIGITTLRVAAVHQIIDLGIAQVTELLVYGVFVIEVGKHTKDFRSASIIALFNTFVLPSFAYFFLWPFYGLLLSI